MTVKGHILLALAPVAIIKPDFFNNPLFIFFITLGAVFPDLDEPQSYIGRKLYFISYPLRWIGLKHRTITHSFIFPAAAVSVAMFFYNIPLLLFLYGYFIHLVGDMLTVTGIPALYPVSKKYYNLFPDKLRFRTGSPTEYILISLLFLIIVYFLKKNNITPESVSKNLHFFYKNMQNFTNELMLSFLKP